MVLANSVFTVSILGIFACNEPGFCMRQQDLRVALPRHECTESFLLNRRSSLVLSDGFAGKRLENSDTWQLFSACKRKPGAERAKGEKPAIDCAPTSRCMGAGWPETRGEEMAQVCSRCTLSHRPASRVRCHLDGNRYFSGPLLSRSLTSRARKPLR
jgi:hypothetical protein